MRPFPFQLTRQRRTSVVLPPYGAFVSYGGAIYGAQRDEAGGFLASTWDLLYTVPDPVGGSPTILRGLSEYGGSLWAADIGAGNHRIIRLPLAEMLTGKEFDPVAFATTFRPQAVAADLDEGYVFVGPYNGAAAYTYRYDLDGANQTEMTYDVQGVAAAGVGYAQYSLHLEPSTRRLYALPWHGTIAYCSYAGRAAGDFDDEVFKFNGGGFFREWEIHENRFFGTINSDGHRVQLGHKDPYSIGDYLGQANHLRFALLSVDPAVRGGNGYPTLYTMEETEGRISSYKPTIYTSPRYAGLNVGGAATNLPGAHSLHILKTA